MQIWHEWEYLCTENHWRGDNISRCLPWKRQERTLVRFTIFPHRFVLYEKSQVCFWKYQMRCENMCYQDLLTSLIVLFFMGNISKINVIPSTSEQSAMSIITCCLWKCQYRVEVSYLWKFLILHVHISISYLWSHTQCMCSYCFSLHTHTVLFLLYSSIGTSWWSE